MINYTDLLYQWREKNIPNADQIKVDEYYSDTADKDILVITAGDSWTYGESLGETRLSDVYGRKVSEALGADWINIGLPGRSNSYIIKNLTWLVKQFKANNYKKIFVIATLTENGREPSESFASSIDFIRLGNDYGESADFYDTLLNEFEVEWTNDLNSLAKSMPSNCNLVVGQNFVWHQNLVDNLSTNINVLKNNWIEQLAADQQLETPPRAKLVTGWIFDSIHAIHNMVPETDPALFKSWAIPYIDQAASVNDWLNDSPLNSKSASKHPLAQGHEIWANYILSQLTVD